MPFLTGKRYRPLAYFGDLLIVYHAGSLISIDINTDTESILCKVSASTRDKIFAWSRLYERLFRREIRATIKADDSHLVYAYNKMIYCLDICSGENKEELRLRNGVSNPYYFCKVAGVKGFEDGVLFGEYLQNRERQEKVGIYARSSQTGQWRSVFEFPVGIIRHIHGIVSAPEHECVYILTGDKDNEAGIWKATNNFNSVEPVLIGCQQYRAVRLFVVGKKIIYATDTPNETNYIYSYDCQDHKLQRLKMLNGSCIYASESKDYIYISSTVEPDERISGWRSWVNYKLGSGILSRDVYVYKITKDNLHIDSIATFKKDFLPYKLFQYGQCDTLFDEKRGKLLLYPIAVKKHDGKLLII